MESASFMHRWCVQAEWQAPIITGRAIRGNLIILAPPLLVILEEDLRHALATLDRLLGELDWL